MKAKSLLWIAVLAAGCSDSGPTRFHVSGTVMFDGKPIPFGHLVFTPDGAKQNAGPQGVATIREGKYDTAAEGKGIAGGPTVISVTGLAGPGGRPLCDYEQRLDLPRANSVHNIEVPANAAVKAPGPGI